MERPDKVEVEVVWRRRADIPPTNVEVPAPPAKSWSASMSPAASKLPAVVDVAEPVMVRFPVTPRKVVVAWLKKAVVAEATVAKRDVVVASVKRARVNVPKAEKKEMVDVARTREVEPVEVSTAKTELEAAFSMEKARPFSGVWMVVVAP